jgi:predicted Zn-dependent peptidase
LSGIQATKYYARLEETYELSYENIRKIVLSNGVRIVLERIPYVRSASLGLYMDVGSRNETSQESGLTHFVEHMLFKGTHKFNAIELSNEINRIGGNVNAWTTQENVAITAKVVDEHISRAIDLIFEMYQQSVFAPEEIDRERNVILEEVKMYDDTPDELVVDVFMDQLYAGNPLGQPILGSPDNIRRFNRDDIRGFIGKEFAPERLVIAIAGNFDLRRIEPQLRRIFETITPSSGPQNPIVHPEAAFKSQNIDRKLEQVHFCMGTTGPCRTSDDRFAFAVLNTILGGGASSRIFQEVREKRGLAYSIGSFDVMFKDSGCFAISGGTSPKNAAKVVDISLEQVRQIYREDITTDELLSAKEQIKSGVLLGLESSSYRMSRLAESEINFGDFIPVNRLLDRVNDVTIEEVRHVAEKYLKDKPVTFAGIAPEKKFEPYLANMAF